MDKITKKYRYSNILVKTNKDKERINANLKKAEIKANRQFIAKEKHYFINKQINQQQGAKK